MTGTDSGPWAFHLHLGAWASILLLGAAVLWSSRSAKGAQEDHAQLRRRRSCLLGACLALAVAFTWPLSDLAARWSLSALVLQRLLLTMLAAPLLLLSLSPSVLARLTHPALVDRVLEVVTRPVTAVVVFSGIVFATLVPGAVSAQASSAFSRALLDSAVLLGGFVLWGPVLRHVPGASRGSALGTAAYLFVQSVVPGFPSVLYIFARHPFYRSFVHTTHVFSMSPLADQQLAGVIGKVGTLPVLWNVAWVVLTRAESIEAGGGDPEVLHWIDVERRLERVERRQHSTRARRRNANPGPDGGLRRGLARRDLPIVYPPGWPEDDRPVEEPGEPDRPGPLG